MVLPPSSVVVQKNLSARHVRGLVANRPITPRTCFFFLDIVRPAWPHPLEAPALEEYGTRVRPPSRTPRADLPLSRLGTRPAGRAGTHWARRIIPRPPWSCATSKVCPTSKRPTLASSPRNPCRSRIPTGGQARPCVTTWPPFGEQRKTCQNQPVTVFAGFVGHILSAAATSIQGPSMRRD